MSWDRGRLWISFNGEIYNFRELRRELEVDGVRFRSQTDTEAILAAYDRWGTDAIHRFVGMFAFGLWDESRQRLWIARDRLGKKPIYYASVNGTFRFASELKAIIVDRSIDRTIDPQALDLYLRFGYVPSPHSIYLHVRKLPPAHELIWERGQITVKRYWDPVPHALTPRRISGDEAIGELEARLTVAVRQRLISDVPLGGFLSGGVDSSLIVALMKQEASDQVRTFTVRFENREYNEADHAAAVARHLGTAHHEQTCTNDQMLDVVERLPMMFDEPFADSSAVPTYLVSKVAREYATVALSGDGGDELFLGYPRHRFHTLGRHVLALPVGVRRIIAAAAERAPTRRLRRVADVLRSDESDSYIRFLSWWTRSEITALTGRHAHDGVSYSDVRTRAATLDSCALSGLLDLVAYLPDDVLTKVDRASMAVSLELRSPLLDHRVVEFALSLPVQLKQRGRASKWLLRQLVYKHVPRQLIERPKMGFGVPLDLWLRGPLRERMEANVRGHTLEKLGLKANLVRALWTDFLRGMPVRADRLWQIFSLIDWANAQTHLDSSTRATTDLFSDTQKPSER